MLFYADVMSDVMGYTIDRGVWGDGGGCGGLFFIVLF